MNYRYNLTRTYEVYANPPRGLRYRVEIYRKVTAEGEPERFGFRVFRYEEIGGEGPVKLLNHSFNCDTEALAELQASESIR